MGPMNPGRLGNGGEMQLHMFQMNRLFTFSASLVSLVIFVFDVSVMWF